MEKAIAVGIPDFPDNANDANDQYLMQESRAFAANYITYRWNSWTKQGTIAAAYPSGYPSATPVPSFSSAPIMALPSGPSILYNANLSQVGIGVRAADITNARSGTYTLFPALYGGQFDLGSERAGKFYLGYAAQPFINEVAIQVPQRRHRGCCY